MHLQVHHDIASLAQEREVAATLQYSLKLSLRIFAICVEGAIIVGVRIINVHCREHALGRVELAHLYLGHDVSSKPIRNFRLAQLLVETLQLENLIVDVMLLISSVAADLIKTFGLLLLGSQVLGESICPMIFRAFIRDNVSVFLLCYWC